MSRWPALLRVLTGLLLVATMLTSGIIIGRLIFRPGAADALRSDVVQVQTSNGTYLGRVAEDDGPYLRLAAPAIVTAVPDAEGQYRVQALASEPYALVGDVMIPHDQILLLGAVAPDSAVAGAYEEALQN